MIYSDFSTNPREVQQSGVETDSVIADLHALKETLFNGSKGDAEGFREVMLSTRLFDSHREIAEEFIREEFQ